MCMDEAKYPRYMFYTLDFESNTALAWKEVVVILCEARDFHVLIHVEPGTPKPKWFVKGKYVYETDEDYVGCEEVNRQLQTQSRYRQRKMRKEYDEALEKLLWWGY